MSASLRNSNIFAAEDYRKVFKSFAFIDYTAYDFDTLKQALINYIQTYYPEDFNDYIESSEFIAIVELLAYFGTSLAFRTELNSRENFIDTAERRESIIRLAQMVNYVPRRNIAASGLFKISAVQTDQPLVDSNGVDINNSAIFWNDPNNPDWFDQFVQVCNAAFNPTNPFGRPSKSGSIGSIPTDLYQLNNILKLNVTYPITVTINGQQYPIDICNPDFTTNETVYERHPDPANAFNFIYRNDSLGVSSSNTGFFLYFKQGNLINIDTNFEFPTPNRLFEINTSNINQDDVYVQETDQNGTVLSKWIKVPALAGENIIYNSIHFAQRNIFDAISGANDTVTIRFADGNFGNVPTGLFRFWARVSANQQLVIRPSDAQGLQINIPYIGIDNQTYTLQIVFNLEQTIGNAAAAETNEQIKLRAPEVFSTQSRMVNGSDYNVLPLIYGNQIAKIQAINRTYSGHSRYIDLNDPTGFHRDLIIFGQDGAIFRDNQNVLTQLVRDSSNSGNIETIIVNAIQEQLRDTRVNNFFYDEYLSQFESKIRVNPSPQSPTGRSLLDLVPTGVDTSRPLFWQTSPVKLKNDTGYFSNTKFGSAVAMIDQFTNTGTYEAWSFIKSGAIIKLANTTTTKLADTTLITVGVNNIIQAGIPLATNSSNPYINIGPIELSAESQTNYQAIKVYPPFRTTLHSSEINEIVTAINAGISFWIYYDLLVDEWHSSTVATSGLSSQVNQPWTYASPSPGSIYSTNEWANSASNGLLYVSVSNNVQLGTTTYDLTARGRVYVFESYKDVRFYWDPNQYIVDSNTGLALKDSVEIMPFVNTNNTVNNNNPNIADRDPSTVFLKKPISFNISGVFVQNDGYTDPAKVEVSPIDSNGDSVPDDPECFSKVVSTSDRVVFEYYTNEITGYQSTRPFISRWKTEFADITDALYVYIPSDGVILTGSPYIANMQLTLNEIPHPEDIINSSFKYIYLEEVDLMFINNIQQLKYTDPLTLADVTIANQLSSFLTTTSTGHYPWLSAAETLSYTVKSEILSTYFLNKIFLVAPTISPPGFGVYYTIQYAPTSNAAYIGSNIVQEYIDKYHFDKNGKVFTQNLTITADSKLPLYFKWSHYSPIDQRVDPAATNIIDMIVITNSYYRDVLIWKNTNSSVSSFPAAPTTEELRIQFQSLDQYKMVSDSMIWNSGTFKILFGSQAAPELQAIFKVVKSLSANISDNEVKTKVVAAIDTYFDIRNWDFGEKFFYTELAAFIHQQLSKIISSVVIVPSNSASQFGNLFEIISNPSELFISTANVNNVAIISNLTDQNLRL